MSEPIIKSPYHHSGKRDTDIATSEWPRVTETELTLRAPPEQCNQDYATLIAARQALFDARMFVSRARTHWKKRLERLPDDKQAARVVERLTLLGAHLQEVYEQVPLEVVKKRGER